MAKKTHKTKKKPMYKTAGFYFVLLYALLTVGMIIQLFTVNVIPTRYCINRISNIITSSFRNVFFTDGEKSKQNKQNIRKNLNCDFICNIRFR